MREWMCKIVMVVMDRNERVSCKMVNKQIFAL